MSLMELSPTQRFQEERSLPALWVGVTHNPARIEWYTRLCVDSNLVHGGRNVVPEFVAAMLLESGLDNLVVGNNAKNGSDNSWLGISWVQLDTGYHVQDLDGLHGHRSDPYNPLFYVAFTPDLCYHGATQTWFNKKRWHAWDPERVDPSDPNQWSPLKACLAAWDRIYP